MHPLRNYKLLDNVFFRTCPRAEDPTAGDTVEHQEALHGRHRHGVYGCDLLRERDVLPYGSETSVERDSEGICDNVRPECKAEYSPPEDKVC